MDGGGYILAVGRWWLIVVGIFWLVVSGAGSWWVALGGGG